MEFRALLSCGLLGTFLLISPFPCLTLGRHDPSYPQQPRRLLANKNRNGIIHYYLAPHNKLRAKLGLPPLKWSKKLANYASWWAHQRQGDCALIHSNSNYGENLFWGSGNDWKVGDAVAEWAAERVNYDYHTNSCIGNKDCLHYTQMVWRQSSKLGCARVTCRNGDTLISCNYDPHGNVVGQKPF